MAARRVSVVTGDGTGEPVDRVLASAAGGLQQSAAGAECRPDLGPAARPRPSASPPRLPHAVCVDGPAAGPRGWFPPICRKAGRGRARSPGTPAAPDIRRRSSWRSLSAVPPARPMRWGRKGRGLRTGRLLPIASSRRSQSRSSRVLAGSSGVFWGLLGSSGVMLGGSRPLPCGHPPTPPNGRNFPAATEAV
jgi:hypothetical protein